MNGILGNDTRLVLSAIISWHSEEAPTLTRFIVGLEADALSKLPGLGGVCVWSPPWPVTLEDSWDTSLKLGLSHRARLHLRGLWLAMLAGQLSRAVDLLCPPPRYDFTVSGRGL